MRAHVGAGDASFAPQRMIEVAAAPRMSVLDPAGPQADSIATLWNIFLGVAVVVWLAVVAFTVIASVRAARRHHGELAPIIDPSRDRTIGLAIVAAGAVTVLTLIALLVASISTSRSLASLDTDAASIQLKIEAHQWWWRVTYYPDEPKRTATLANEIHVPVGVPVRLRLESADVIHSFWVPSLHGKKDLVPGRVNYTTLRVDQPGTYRGACAEFCGLQHAQMMITVIAEPLPQFMAWLANQRTRARVPSDVVAQRGKHVFESGPCITCHTITGTRAASRFGPDLTHFGSRLTIGATGIPNSVETLQHWLVDPHGIKPGVTMPATALDSGDLFALASYLESLQ